MASVCFIQNKNSLHMLNLDHTWPVFTDHALLHFKLNRDKQSLDVAWRRDWRAYNKDMLCLRLSSLNWNFTSDSVQAYWNELENQLVAVIDELAPMVKHLNAVIQTPRPQ